MRNAGNAVLARSASRALRGAAGLWVGIAVASGAQAQQARPEPADKDVKGLETITITATKRSESVQDVPVAVTAISGLEMAERGLKSSIELLDLVPNADLQMQNGSTGANIFVRGIGTKGPAHNQTSGIGIYTDEISLNSQIVNILQLYDLQRVEVLRGPQNTLYGRNTTGGAINFVSVRPDIGGGTGGDAALTLGSYSQRDLEGALGFDLGAAAAGRFAFLVQRRDGVYDAVNTGTKAYDRESNAGRLQFAFAPSSSLSVLLRGHVEAVDNINKLWKGIGLRSPVPVVVGGVNTYPTDCTTGIGLGSSCVSPNGLPSDPNDHTTFGSGTANPIEKVDASGLSATVNWDLPFARLTSITAYERNEYQKAEDADGVAAPLQRSGPFPGPASPLNQAGFDFFQVSEASQWSQELRLTSPGRTSLRWIAGLFLFKEELVGNTTAVPYFASRANSTRLDQDTRVSSAYGEMEYDISPRFSAVAGARVSDEEVDGFNTTVQRVLNDAAVAAALLPISGQHPITTDQLLALPVGTGRNVLVDAPYGKSWRNSGGRAGLKYKFDDATMAYADVSRGFKAGSFGAGPAQSINGSFFAGVNPETLTALQLGLKSTLLGNTLQFNVAGFVYRYKDQQLLQTAVIDGTIVTAVVNAAKSRASGLELEARWAPGGGWTADLSLGYLSTRIDEFLQPVACTVGSAGCNSAGVRYNDFSGNELNNAPRWTGNLALHKEIRLANNLRLRLGGDVAYKSSRFFNLPNNQYERDDSYSVLNLQAAIRRGSYAVTLWGKNVTNTLYFLQKAGVPGPGGTGTQEALISDPRTFGVTFSAGF
jgi:iron complex outermembrane recepter protein